MSDILLQEATLQDICEEISNRSLSHLFIARSFSGSEEDAFPFISFSSRPQDLAEMIGITEAAKTQLVDEFRDLSSMLEDREQ